MSAIILTEGLNITLYVNIDPIKEQIVVRYMPIVSGTTPSYMKHMIDLPIMIIIC